MSPRARRWIARRTRRQRILVAVAALTLVGLSALWLSLPDVRPLATVNPTTTRMIELRRKQAADKRRPFRLRWQWRPLSRISPYLQRAAVLSEDAQFWKHEGVDWDAMKKAAEHDWHERSMERGASTITQQVAKNLYLSPSRNPLRKLRELLIARRLDRALGKSRVLEIYLNIAEWGDGVFGAEAAARRWFGCSAEALTPAQAARLVVALPNPFKRSPEAKSRALARRAARLVRGLRRAGVIDDAALAQAERDLGVAAAEAKATALPEPPEPDDAEPADAIDEGALDDSPLDE
jgi:monofunctional biosynthetic peptidoglycan transglycosylase